jgi:PAS domain S-box-containing protein
VSAGEATHHEDEARRLAALLDLEVLDTPQEERFDRITRVAAALFDVPIAMVSMVDAHRLFWKSCIGLAGREAARDGSFCPHVILQEETLLVPDTRLDPRFADSDAVTGELGIRFYAGHPLHAPGGERVGTLCIADRRPRDLDDAQIARLRDLACLAERELSDVQARVAAVRARRSEDGLRTVMESVGDGIVTFDPQGRIRWANAAAEHNFRAGHGDLVGQPVASLLDGGDWSEVAPQVGAAGEAGPALGSRRLVTGLRRDGEPFPMELLVSEAWVDGERLFVAVGQDVTARERAARELHDSERRFRAIFDRAGIGISLTDAEGRLVDVNPAMAAMFGYTREQLIEMPFAELRHPDEPVPEQLIDALRAAPVGQDVRAIRRYRRADGSTMWGAATLTALGESDERIAGGHTIGMLADITLEKEAERLKDEFVAIVSHELRTPLTTIRGSIGLVAGGVVGDLPPEAAAMLRVAVDNTDRLVRLVNDILDIERLESGRIVLEVGEASSRALVDESVRAVESAALAAGVRLRPQIVDLQVLADADRVVQALVNLLGNAIKFSAAGSPIGVRVERSGRRALFSVSDMGRGIPADDLDAIFDRFRQVDASDARVKGGTGLGLAIARGIVEQHGGRIWAESAPGQGSTFRFTLPLAEARVPILVCGADPASSASVAELVEGLGHRATIAIGLDAALAAVAHERPAAVAVPLGASAPALVAALGAAPETADIPAVVIGDADGDLLAALQAVVPELQPGGVLVVEDDPALAEVLCAAIGSRGLEVRVAATAGEAIESIRRAPPDLVVLDLVLPGDDGFSVVDRLRADGLLAGTPLLVYSAMDLTPADRARLQLGNTEFLEKTRRAPQDVQDRVAELLERVVEAPA